MDYEITIGGRSEKVTLSRSAGEPEQYEFQGAAWDQPLRVTVVRREPSQLVLSIAERIYSVRPFRRSPGGAEFLVNGELVSAALVAKGGPKAAGAGVASVNELVVSHFPAKVVRILVANGARVKAGETLLILESMKMETHVDAPRECTVLELFVAEGEMVNRGAKLTRLDFG